MEITERATVVGVFERPEQAERAIRDLQEAGFGSDRVGYATPGGEATGGTHPGTTEAMDLGAETGTQAHREFTGALTGAGIGGVLGAAAMLLIPGLGPAALGGALVGLLAGAGTGAAAGGLIGALQGMDLSEDDARYYEQEFRVGRTLVTVRADGRPAKAADILLRHGAYGLAGEREVRRSV